MSILNLFLTDLNLKDPNAEDREVIDTTRSASPRKFVRKCDSKLFKLELDLFSTLKFMNEPKELPYKPGEHAVITWERQGPFNITSLYEDGFLKPTDFQI